MKNNLLNARIKELEMAEDDSLELDDALSKMNEISNIINNLIKETNLDNSAISQLYGTIANLYLISSKKVKNEYKFNLAFSSNYWKMLETQTSPVKNLIKEESKLEDRYGTKRMSERTIINKLITKIHSAKTTIKITCGEAGFLQRNPDLVDSIVESLDRGIDVSVYYLDIQDKSMVERLGKNGCKMIKGLDYSKLHYLIIDNFAYVHTHERYQDRFIYNNEDKVNLLKQDFEKLIKGIRGPEQKSNSDEMKGIIYNDADIISLLIGEINSAKKEIYIACGLGILLRKNQDLVRAIDEACRRGIRVYLYYVYIPSQIAEQLIQCGCVAIRGNIYPRLHYWIIDNFIYESTHPRQNDQFYNDDANVRAELENNFNILIKSAS
jgi:phosphatidylserine/phosphatidylglycerophosphate/cardiolipin synthase-like enzyme